MTLDILTLTALKDELCESLIGKKIDKIQQPERDMIIMSLRGRPDDARRLLISVNVNDTRIHLTEHMFSNPESPPMFCMLLRKHLIGARIDSIYQPLSERIFEFSLSSSTALGDASAKRLIMELFGHVPNVILTDSDGIIIDCLRRISGDLRGKRMLLPGLKYTAPESVNVSKHVETGIKKSQQTIDASSLDIVGSSISQRLDEVFTHKLKGDNMRRRSSSLNKTMKTAHKRTSRRLAAQTAELGETARRDYYRECADIIMANMHSIKTGDELLVADDFYAENEAKREIKLDPLLNPQRNAALYYKAYTKARNAVDRLTEQISYGKMELEYIESVIEQIARAESEHELQEIRTEIVKSKYLKEKNVNSKKAKKIQSKPLQLKSSTGLQILVGKNNTQNDLVTFKIATKSDIWLHVQKLHGAHVIIKTGGLDVDDVTLQEAASIAVYYSAARHAGKVLVDYTLVKNVKKTPAARPGMVIYTDYKTIVVEGELPATV